MHKWVLFWERVLPIAILVMAAVGAPILILAPEGLPRLRALSRELAEVELENAQLRRDVHDLHGKVQHLREDPVTVERIARDELGLVRSSEVVFQFSRRP